MQYDRAQMRKVIGESLGEFQQISDGLNGKPVKEGLTVRTPENSNIYVTSLLIKRHSDTR